MAIRFLAHRLRGLVLVSVCSLSALLACGSDDTTSSSSSSGAAGGNTTSSSGNGGQGGSGGGVGGGVGGAGGPAAGAHVIMYDPQKSSDSNGEWVELFNPGSAAVDIDGYTLRDNDANVHVIKGSVVVPAGGFAVLARNGTVKDNGGVNADYVYGEDFFLANSTDAVVLENGSGDLVDSVSYGSSAPWPEKKAGVSIELTAPEADNAEPSNWALAVAPFGDGDLGTPGAPNGGQLPTFSIDDKVVGWHQPALKTSVYFAPNDNVEPKVLEHLTAASKTIRLAFFNIRLPAVKNLLVQKVNDGVDVHVLLDKKQQDLAYNTMGEELKNAGVTVTLIENQLAVDATMHNKFALLDGKTLMAGSANYSFTALNKSDEDLVILEDPALVARYQLEFDELIAAGDVSSAPYMNGEKIQAWMGPEDGLNYKIADALDGAQTTAVVAMFQLNASKIVDALIAAHKRGVVVVVVLDKIQADQVDALADEALAVENVPVLLADNTNSNYAEMHSKFLVVDHKTVLMGSYNWTNLGSFHNDENILIIQDAHLAARTEGKLAEMLLDYKAPPAATLGLTTGPQSVSFEVSNVTLDPGLKLRIKSVNGGPFPNPVELDGGSVQANIEAGTRVTYSYEISYNGQVLAQESATRSFTVPFAPGPFTVKDAFEQ